MIKIYTNTLRYQKEATKSCWRKRRHHTAEEAIKAAKNTQKRYKKRFCVYLCRFCADYHVGTDTEQRYKRKIKQLKK